MPIMAVSTYLVSQVSNVFIFWQISFLDACFKFSVMFNIESSQNLKWRENIFKEVANYILLKKYVMVSMFGWRDPNMPGYCESREELRSHNLQAGDFFACLNSCNILACSDQAIKR